MVNKILNSNNSIWSSKRAQISLFIIVAIVIVSVIIVILFLRKPGISSSSSPEILPIGSFVDSCVKSTGYEAVQWIGSTGGYLTVSQNSLNDSAYYFYNGENHMPSKEFMERSLAGYMDNLLPICLGDFEDFLDFKISLGVLKSNAKIENNQVIFNIQYPLSISKSDKTYLLEKFESQIPVRLGVIYDVSNKIMLEQMKKKDAICFNCINQISEDNNLIVNMFSEVNSSVLFIINDPNSQINGRSYNFYFVNKY